MKIIEIICELEVLKKLGVENHPNWKNLNEPIRLMTQKYRAFIIGVKSLYSL